jgi:hypothetical protein
LGKERRNGQEHRPPPTAHRFGVCAL